MTENDNILMTFALFVYNQQDYIEEAIESAFSQTYEPLEIIISDDCSTDKTFSIIEKMVKNYKGCHKVLVRKNARNMGVAMHFDLVMRMSKGELVVVAAGDDISESNRVTENAEVYINNNDVSVIDSGYINFFDNEPDRKISIKNKEPSKFSLSDIFSGSTLGLSGASRSYARRKYCSYSPISSKCPTEDTTALFRCLYFGEGIYKPEVLVRRRIHPGNLSGLNSLLTMDFDAIEDQYSRDIAEALDHSIIRIENYQDIKLRLERYSYRKRVNLEVNTGFRKKIGFQNIIFSPHLSLREKIYFLRKGIKFYFTYSS